MNLSRFTSTPAGTWIGHALVSLAAALVVALTFILWPAWDGGLGFAVGATAAALYYLYREDTDRLKHFLAGDYDFPQEGSGVTSREDRVGDLLGPWTLTVARGSPGSGGCRMRKSLALAALPAVAFVAGLWSALGPEPAEIRVDTVPSPELERQVAELEIETEGLRAARTPAPARRARSSEPTPSTGRSPTR